MGLLDKVTSKVNYYTNKANKYVSQAEVAIDEFNRFRNDVDTIFDTSADTLLSDLKSLSSGVVTTKAGSWIDSMEKAMNQVNDTKALVNRVNSIVNDGTSIYSTVRDLSSAGSSAANKAMSYIESQGKGNKISNAFTPEFSSKLNKYDPISEEIDLSDLVRNLAEDVGMITNKFRGIQFSREFHFIERPELEADRGGRYRSYVFFTRPDLHLVQRDKLGSNTLAAVPDLLYYPELLSKVVTDLPLYAELCLTGAKKSNLWPLLSNYCKEVAPVRISETFREGTKNMHGVESPVPGAPEYHNIDLSITFSDNARGDIAKLFDMMQEYKHFVTKETFPKLDDYIKHNANDAAMSIYIVTVDADWSVIGFGVALNCIPMESPSHFTQHRAEGFSKQELLDEFTITFKCKTYKPYRPLYFDYFNRISGFNPYAMVDTKGSAFTLQAGSRIGTGSAGTYKRSVFSPDSDTITDFNVLGSGYGGYGINDFTKLTGITSYNGMLNPSSNASLSPGQKTGSSKVIGYFPVQGVFEMLAKTPGIYRALNLNEPNRPIFKLGFSY